jgi:hypothetical protein
MTSSSNTMGIPYAIHDTTRFPAQTDGEILIAMKEDVYTEQMKLDAKGGRDQIQAEATSGSNGAGDVQPSTSETELVGRSSSGVADVSATQTAVIAILRSEDPGDIQGH